MNDDVAAKEFNDALIRYSQEFNPKDRKIIERQVWSSCGKTISTMVIDMSGFTRLTESYGVVHYLSMVRRMQLTAKPIIESYGGKIVKFEADNAFTYFDKPDKAIRAAIALNFALDSANIITHEELDIRISCGIDHGECLLPHPHDYYGGPVNKASKLGEDLGKPGEILVTDHAFSYVPASLGIETQPTTLSITDMPETIHFISYRK